MSDNQQQATKVVIGPVRLSYLQIWEPKASDDSDDASKKKYSACFIIPKTDKKSIAMCEAAINVAKQNGKAGVFDGKIPTGDSFKNALRDGDINRPDDEAFHGGMFINASTVIQPGIVAGPDRHPVTNREEVYSGCYAYVSINFYPFSVKGNKGVGAGLYNIWKVKDGERLDNRTKSVETDFANIEVNFEDDDSAFL